VKPVHTGRTPWSRLLLGGAALLAFDVARRLFRNRQLFEPSRLPARGWDPADYGLAPERVEDLRFDSGEGQQLHAWYCRAERPVASALYCHGNAGNLTHFAEVMPRLNEAGISVFLFDYRGYGRSSGHLTVHGVVRDALAAAKKHDELRPPGLPSIVYGFSLGGAVAAQLAAQHPFDGLILQSTFTSLRDMARVVFPRLPLHLLSGRHFDTREAVRRLDLPVLILHGTHDEWVPSRMANELFASLRGTKRMVTIDGGLHNDLFTRDPERLVREVRAFAEGLTALRPSLFTGAGTRVSS
jgi:alpha-beta hydrolase superfamily lysophospholipase